MSASARKRLSSLILSSRRTAHAVSTSCACAAVKCTPHLLHFFGNNETNPPAVASPPPNESLVIIGVLPQRGHLYLIICINNQITIGKERGKRTTGCGSMCSTLTMTATITANKKPAPPASITRWRSFRKSAYSTCERVSCGFIVDLMYVSAA